MTRYILYALLILPLGFNSISGQAEYKIPTSKRVSTSLATQPQKNKIPLLADQKTLPEAEKKSSWSRAKKHLKRYWRRYALATVAILVAVDNLSSRQASTHALQAATEPSPLERLAAYLHNRILHVTSRNWSPRRLHNYLQKRFAILKGRSQERLSIIKHSSTTHVQEQIQSAEHLARWLIRNPKVIEPTKVFNLSPGTRFKLSSETYFNFIFKTLGEKEVPVHTDFTPANEHHTQRLQLFRYADYDNDKTFAFDERGEMYRADSRGPNPTYYHAYSKSPTHYMSSGYSKTFGGFDADKRSLFVSGSKFTHSGHFYYLSPTPPETEANSDDLKKSRAGTEKARLHSSIAHYNEWGVPITPRYDTDGCYLGLLHEDRQVERTNGD